LDLIYYKIITARCAEFKKFKIVYLGLAGAANVAGSRGGFRPNRSAFDFILKGPNAALSLTKGTMITDEPDSSGA
jgi:hypothetical protein